MSEIFCRLQLAAWLIRRTGVCCVSVHVCARAPVHDDYPARGDYPDCGRASEFRQVLKRAEEMFLTEL